MAAKSQFQPLHLQISLLLLFLFSDFISASQSTPQNIQVYFPIPTPPPPSPLLPPSPTTPPPETTTAATSRSSSKPIAKAVAITASSTLVFSVLLFLSLLKLKRRSKKETTNLYADSRINYSNDNPGLQKNDEFFSFGKIKRVIVDDEQGLDVIYLKKLQDNSGRKSKFDFPVQEIHFLKEKSSGSRVWPVADHISDSVPAVDLLKDVRNQETVKTQPLLQSPPPPPPPNAASPPPSPPVVGGKSNAPLPPLPPKTGGLTLSTQRPPPPPQGHMSLSNANQVKLKPLYWDKVNANVGHEMVWHKLHNGSFR